MPWLIVLLVILWFLTTLPNLWTRHILNKYRTPHPDIPGTGHQFAEHLIKKYHLAVKLEETDRGDHYDPIEKVIRISSENFHSNSLTAITTVAHEVGHALQDQQNYEPLKQRTAMMERAHWMQKLGGGALIITPFLIPLAHTPWVALLTFGAGFIAMGVPVLLHLSTLPVEWDASFNRALPLLKDGKYLSEQDLKISRKILRACAMTYVAASLSSLFNLWKWFKTLKRR